MNTINHSLFNVRRWLAEAYRSRTDQRSFEPLSSFEDYAHHRMKYASTDQFSNHYGDSGNNAKRTQYRLLKAMVVEAMGLLSISTNHQRTKLRKFSSLLTRAGGAAIIACGSASGVTGIGIRLRQAAKTTVTVNKLDVPVLFSGASGQDPGLDPASIGPLPRSLAVSRFVAVAVAADGVQANGTSVISR